MTTNTRSELSTYCVNEIGWRPLEDCPKDGTPFIVTNADGDVQKVVYDEVFFELHDFTHFMLLGTIERMVEIIRIFSEHLQAIAEEDECIAHDMVSYAKHAFVRANWCK